MESITERNDYPNSWKCEGCGYYYPLTQRYCLKCNRGPDEWAKRDINDKKQ